MEQTSSAVSHSSNKSEFLVSGKYRLVRKIGSGSFGDIYLGINVTNGEVGNYLAIMLFSSKSHLIILIFYKGNSRQTRVNKSAPPTTRVRE